MGIGKNEKEKETGNSRRFQGNGVCIKTCIGSVNSFLLAPLIVQSGKIEVYIDEVDIHSSEGEEFRGLEEIKVAEILKRYTK